VLRHSAALSDYVRDPIIVARSSGKGVSLECILSETAVRLEHAGRQAREVIVFPASLLAQVEGRHDDPVTLEVVAPDQGRVNWSDAGIPLSRDFDIIATDKRFFFPPSPEDMRSPGSGFKEAMAEAVNSTSPKEVPRSLHKVQLRGSTGQVVGTDGRQLFMHGGFVFPWRNSLLVPAIHACGHRELADEQEPMIGQTETHLFVQFGQWTFALKTDAVSKYPAVEQVIPNPRGVKTKVQFGADDVALLCKELSRLPGRKDDPAEVTLVVGKDILIRGQFDDQAQPSDLPLAASEATGQPVKISMYSRCLLRALKLGFTRVEIVRDSTPLCCRDENRIYLWMPLPEEAAREKPEPAVSPSAPETSEQKEEPTMPEPNGNGKHANNGDNSQAPVFDPLAEAEAIRGLMLEASTRLGRLIAALKNHRKQTRAVRAAVKSLRDLPPLLP
jgi:hypothetical protein